MLSFTPYPDNSTEFLFEPDHDTEMEKEFVEVRQSHKVLLTHFNSQNKCHK